MSLYHKTDKTCKTMYKSKENSKAAPQPCRRREAAGWLASHNPKKDFDGFAGFVKKQLNS